MEIEKRFLEVLTQWQTEMHEALKEGSGDLQSKVREAVIDEILEAFPALRRDGFLPGSTSTAPINSIQVASSGTAGTINDVFSSYPEGESVFLDAILAANLGHCINGKGTDFHLRKERLLILLHLLKNYPNLTMHQTFRLRDAVLNRKDNHKVVNLLRTFAKGEKTTGA